MVAEVLGRVWSSGVSRWYMRSYPICLRLLFVVRSAWRFVLICSSVLSVPFPPSLGFGPFTGTKCLVFFH